MSNTITLSAPRVAGLPAQNGTRTLKTTPNITATSPTGTVIDVTSDEIGITLVPTGTLDDASVIELQAQINGSSFFPVYIGGAKVSWTGAQLKTAAGAGVTGRIETIRLKCAQIRFVMSTVGSTSGSNGIIARVFD